MIQNHYKTKEDFNEAKNGESFDDSSIYFIEETNEVYTHGKFYKRYEWGMLNNPKVGEIVLVNNNTLEKIVVKPDDLEKYKNTYTPIGVVVIPKSHNVYGTGECAILSTLSMSSSNPTIGANTEQEIIWFSGNINTGLTKYDVINTITNATDNILGEPSNIGKLPSTNTNGNFDTMSADGIAKYHTNSYDQSLSPSPYLADGSRNPNYYSKELSEYNALSDFDGLENTIYIFSILRSAAKAAYTCSQFKTIGTESGDWYLPACGELGYMIARFNEIQSALITIRTVYGTSYASLLVNDAYWSSSEYSFYEVIDLVTLNGGFDKQNRSINLYVRAFLRLKL